MVCFCRKCAKVFNSDYRVFYCDKHNKKKEEQPPLKIELEEINNESTPYKRYLNLLRHPYVPLTLKQIKNNCLKLSEMKIGGVYFLLDDKLDVLYVGKSKNVFARLHKHRKDNARFKIPIKHFYYIPCNAKESDRLEYCYIKEFQPLYNINVKNINIFDKIKRHITYET